MVPRGCHMCKTYLGEELWMTSWGEKVIWRRQFWSGSSDPGRHHGIINAHIFLLCFTNILQKRIMKKYFWFHISARTLVTPPLVWESSSVSWGVFIRIRRLSAQTPLGAWLDSGPKPCFEVPSDLWVDNWMIKCSD